ncbi:MAG: SGNH/GDSL hydrolase family protein [Cyanobacteriota bacterium]|nr:SGNH/GDSL hydrolase family protein [Cyanobacteriota bacterium]
MGFLSKSVGPVSLRQGWVSIATMAGVALLLGALPTQAKLSQLETLFVFGDSYSDAGNSGLLTQAVLPPSGFPPAPYANGRASNGPVAVEQLWSLFNPSAPPLRPSHAGGTNYAVVGATSGRDSQFAVDDNPQIVPLRPFYQLTSGYSQLQSFLTPAQAFNPNTTLFVFWLGANDGLYWLKTRDGAGLGSTPGTITGNPPSAGKTVNELLANALGNIETGLQSLIGAGATNILVPNLIDLSRTPLYSNDPSMAATVKQMVLGFNAGLATTLTSLQATNPGVDLIAFDTFSLFNQISNNPAAYGLSNITDRCVSNAATCNPDQWFFWDGTHPTSKGHSLFAQGFYNQVPAPLPLAGAGAMVGWSRQLRRRVRGSQERRGDEEI